jgi:hypothetical protein
MKRSRLLGASLLLMTTLCFAQVGKMARQLGLGTGLSDSKISSGLKQALQIGAEQSVKLTGRPNGYFGNPDIKILMPNNLRTLEKGLRMLGFGPKVDDFVLSMNRAAEVAAPAARKIFIDAITAMSFDDTRGILSGNNTAATNYFKDKTAPQLRAAFTPVVERSTATNGVTQRYNSLVAHCRSIPFAKNQDLDITHYVVSKALDGSFTNWARKNARFARIRRRKPPTCSGKYSDGDGCLASIARASSRHSRFSPTLQAGKGGVNGQGDRSTQNGAHGTMGEYHVFRQPCE